jgi:hypothetical protein
MAWPALATAAVATAAVSGCGPAAPDAAAGGPGCAQIPVVGKATFTYEEFTNWPHRPRDVEWLVDGEPVRIGGNTRTELSRVGNGPDGTSTWRSTLYFVPTHLGETVDVQSHDYVGPQTFMKDSRIGDEGCAVQPAS